MSIPERADVVIVGGAIIGSSVASSGQGLQQATAVGRGLAEWIAAGRYLSLDPSPLGYARIAAGEPVRELNVV